MIRYHEIIEDFKTTSPSGAWQSSFLDIVLLLMSFFIIIVGISRFDSFNMAISADDQDLENTVAIKERSINNLFLELSLLLEREISNGLMNIELEDNEINVTVSNELLYDVGSAELYPLGMDVLERIASRIALIEDEEFFVDVEGHTDNRPVIGGRYESNWDLSTARSSNVVEVLLENGFTPQRIRASGYADAQPLVPNVDEFGNPIEENQAKNRRFELRMYMN